MMQLRHVSGESFSVFPELSSEVQRLVLLHHTLGHDVFPIIGRGVG